MIRHIDKEDLEKLLTWKRLIEALRHSFLEDTEAPKRLHYDLEHSSHSVASMLLLMPAWKAGGNLGIKIIIMSHGNAESGLSTIQGSYLLFEADTGLPMAILDAPSLTNLRTAAVSALASTYLSRDDSSRLLVIGTGSLAPYLVRAHCAVRPIRRLYIWGRNYDKACRMKENLTGLDAKVEVVENFASVLGKVDIISTATSSSHPLIDGRSLTPGQHLDLVGAYKPDMQEADEEAISRSKLYIDTPHCLEEAGDIIVPLKKDMIGLEHIQGDLFNLAREEIMGRKSQREITCFKSVGHASEDLAAASLAYELSSSLDDC